MSTLTSGHLASHGGIRGHSAGDIYPFRVMAQGTFDAMKWYVVKPDGDKLGNGFTTSKLAFTVARVAFNLWSR